MRTRPVVPALVGLLVVVACLWAPQAEASGGMLDPNFGDPGFGTPGTASTHCGCSYGPSEVLVDSAGAIFQARDHGGLTRYDQQGHYDSSFVSTDPAAFAVRAFIGSDDKFTLVATLNGSGAQVVRLNHDGSRDTGYGADGVAQLGAVPMDVVRDAALAADGSVVLAGWNNGQQLAVIAKVTPAGTLDTTFNPTGPVPGTLTTPGYPWSVSVDAQGRALVSFQTGNLGAQDTPIQRYEPNGSLDTAYGNAGVAVFPEGQIGHISILRMINAGSGETFGVGKESPPTGDHEFPVIVKLTSAGQPDTSFNGTGIQSTDINATGQQMYREAIPDGNGGLWATGSNSTDVPRSLFLSHITADGSYDQGFSNRGLYWYGVNSEQSPTGLALASDGDVLLGRKYYGLGDFTGVDKVMTSGLPPPTAASATPTNGGLSLAWTNPATQSFASAEVRYALGSTSPTLVTDGISGYNGIGSAAQLAFPSGTDVALSVFTHDFASTTSVPLSLQLLGTHSAATQSTTRVTYPGAVIIGDKVTTATTSSPVAGVTVALYARPHGRVAWNGSPVAIRTTNSVGAASASVVPQANTDYQWRFAGRGAYLYSNSPVASVGMAPRIILRASRAQAPLRTAVQLLGSVAPNNHGQVVVLQQLVAHHWRTTAEVRLTSNSTYSFSVRPKSRGTFYFRVVKSATASQIAGTSNTARLKIT